MIYKEPICLNCKHYNLENSNCSAFAKQIPDEIYLGDNDHKKPLPKQGNNIVFEKIKKDSK